MTRDPLFPISAEALSALVGGRVEGDRMAMGRRVTTDSREAIRSGDIFVGLVGERFDGGRFAQRAFDEGASIAVVAEATSAGAERIRIGAGQAVVSVGDSLLALQSLARGARERLGGTVVGITGSNGKTTVKEMLGVILGPHRTVAASPLSWNSQVGVSLALLRADPRAEVVLIECGISEPGEMERLERVVQPDLGVFVNVGDAHIGSLGSQERIAEEKSLLFRGVEGRGGVVLVPEAERRARAALDARGIPAVVVPAAADGEWPESVAAEPFRGDASLALAAAARLGVEREAAKRSLGSWHAAPMRLEISTTPLGVLLINDAYSADPRSVELAIDALQRERTSGRAIAVLGGMSQLGMMSRSAHAKVGERLVERRVDELVAIGAGGAEIAQAARTSGMALERTHLCADVEEAASVLDEIVRPGDRVLLKGSRPERLERVAASLFASIGPSRLYVDLDRIAANLDAVRRVVGKGVAVMAVVKSFGYGVDSVRVARALERAGVDHFAVAYPDEGVVLRERGIAAPILVQNVLPGEVDKVVRFGLSAQVSHMAQVEAVDAEASRQRRSVRVHLKVDTGMGRAGAYPGEALELARRVTASELLSLDGVMSHLAAADDPKEDAFTARQIATFDAVLRELGANGIRFRWAHVCNSAGLVRFPGARHTMVRAGLGLFGYAEGPGLEGVGWQPSLRLVTRVVSVKRIPAGHAVGYGMTWRAEDGERSVAVVAIGYSDGYPWALGNRGWMAVHGTRCPVVGRVCMDVSMIDVTEVRAEVRPGDDVIVFGPGFVEPSLPELARLAGTIPYEILSRLSPRLRRIFDTAG